MVEIINGVKDIKKLNIGKGLQSTPIINKTSGLQSTPIVNKKGFKNISYKSVNRTKLNNMNNNSFSNNRIRFNTKEISNHLVSYEDAYILLEVDIKFATEANASRANIRLKNSYEMVHSIKIEFSRTIISNEDYIYYSNMIPHLLENSKSDDLLYRGIDLHDKVTFETNINKNIFITNQGDTVKVKILIYLKDIIIIRLF